MIDRRNRGRYYCCLEIKSSRRILVRCSALSHLESRMCHCPWGWGKGRKINVLIGQAGQSKNFDWTSRGSSTGCFKKKNLLILYCSSLTSQMGLELLCLAYLLSLCCWMVFGRGSLDDNVWGFPVMYEGVVLLAPSVFLILFIYWRACGIGWGL